MDLLWMGGTRVSAEIPEIGLVANEVTYWSGVQDS